MSTELVLTYLVGLATGALGYNVLVLAFSPIRERAAQRESFRRAGLGYIWKQKEQRSA